ncbi:MAG: TonB-dependent receptor plug domain-containing protein [Betaproteobacteria bacterium]|nr:TonB-dependent receptor plug domain-containing protein [Betaproteobacteria bacterium]
MFTDNRINNARGQIVGGALVLLLALPAVGQEPAQKVEKVEVTGSSIKRIEGETALPVLVVSKEEIVRSGATNTEELLKSVSTTSTNGSTSAANTGAGGGQGGGGSQSLISLRGLGSARTLVLINGRRTAPAGGNSAVDVSTIPLTAIERLDVLKDGASAVYGSDAVAGVINFILRKDYKGTEITASYGAPTPTRRSRPPSCCPATWHCARRRTPIAGRIPWFPRSIRVTAAMTIHRLWRFSPM